MNTVNRQGGIKVRKRYLALRSFFCGAGGVLKNLLAMSSIVIGFGADRFAFVRMVGV